MLENLLFFTNAQKTLFFLIKNTDKEFFDREISKFAGISRAGANFALRDLVREGLLLRQKRGRMYFYIVFLHPLVEKLKKLSLKINLYGDAAKGENHSYKEAEEGIVLWQEKEILLIVFPACLWEVV